MKNRSHRQGKRQILERDLHCSHSAHVRPAVGTGEDSLHLQCGRHWVFGLDHDIYLMVARILTVPSVQIGDLNICKTKIILA